MKWKRVLPALLIMVLLICGQRNLAAAGKETDEEQDKVEIIEQREADKKYYALPDGTFQCVVYSQRVHFINEIGVFEEIDNTLIRERFQTDATTYAWRMPGMTSLPDLQRMQSLARILSESRREQLRWSLDLTERPLYWGRLIRKRFRICLAELLIRRQALVMRMYSREQTCCIMSDPVA